MMFKLENKFQFIGPLNSRLVKDINSTRIQQLPSRLLTKIEKKDGGRAHRNTIETFVILGQMTTTERANDEAYIGYGVESAKHKRALSLRRDLSEEGSDSRYAVFENTFCVGEGNSVALEANNKHTSEDGENKQHTVDY